MVMGRVKLRLLPAGLAVLFILAVLAAFVHIYSTSARGTGETSVASVNGEPIYAAEFHRQLSLLRASVIDYFKQEYGAELGKNFWYTAYRGEVPADMLKERALEEAVKSRIQLGLAKAYGIIDETTHAYFLSEMEKENARRSAAVRAGQPVYGPSRFNESTFKDYYISKILIQLKEKMAGDVLAATDAELRDHYDRIKGDLFRKEDNVRFYKITVSYTEKGQDGGNDAKPKAEETIRAVKRRLEQGESVQEAARQQQNVNGSPGILLSEERFNQETARNYFTSEPELYGILADSAESGRVSTVVDDRQAGRYVLAVIISNDPGGYKSYEEQEGNVRKHYTDSRFDDYLNKLVRGADVRIHEKNYGAIMVR
jgi:hypothetical protein